MGWRSLSWYCQTRYSTGKPLPDKGGLCRRHAGVYDSANHGEDVQMGLLKMLGLGDKEKICAGCGEKSVLRDRKQINPRHPNSTRY